MSNRSKIVLKFVSRSSPTEGYGFTTISTFVTIGVGHNIRTAALGPQYGSFEYQEFIDMDMSAADFVAMLLYHSLDTYYDISRVSNVVTIEAKEYNNGTYYDFTAAGVPGGYVVIDSRLAEQIDALGASETITGAICGDVADADVTVAVTGGAPAYGYNTGDLGAYTYLWSDGPTTRDRTNMADGTYWVKITDSVGNVFQISNIVILSASIIVVTGVVTNATGGGNNGEIDVSVSGGVAPYTYEWDDAPTTQDRLGIPSGSYGVTVTDDNGCTMYKLFNVADDASLIVIGSVKTDVLCNGASTGAIDLTPSLGTGPYTFLWNDGATTEDRTDLPAGTYNVWVTDSVGSIQTKEIIITEPDVVAITASINGDAITLSVVGGVGPYTYSWDTGETTKDITVPLGGDYTVTVTDDNGCVKQAVVTVPRFEFFFSENPIELALELTDDYGTHPNESFVCEVYIEKVYDPDAPNFSHFDKVIELEQPADTDGKTVFDVQETIHAYLLATLPTWEKNSLELADGHFVRFYLKHAEKYSDPAENPPTLQGLVQEDTFYGILGGISDLEHAADTFKESYLPTVKPFFTWEPTEQSVYDAMQLYLHFMVNAFNLGAIELHGKVTYTDGTTTSLQLLNQISSTKRFELYRVPVGYTQLDLGVINPAKEVAKYEVWMEDDSANVISEIRTFTLVDRPHFSRMFIYLNSMGGWSTLRAEGYANGRMRVKETTLQRKLESGYGVTDTEVEVVKKSGQQQLQIQAVANDNVDAAHLQDFAISRKVFELTAGRFEPVRIDYDPDYMDEEENVVPFTFVVLPPVMKKYTPAL